ncbi:hypothetical protein PIB30_063310 [Stylosanthes scabra]|uniref:Uncharacterized protein n=1 Tax=Stylosanthes scabra TaxID=79078 RepID=A0ABU6QM33_9FABA|nr:hypothetical protein [Stylosanthes scabra]
MIGSSSQPLPSKVPPHPNPKNFKPGTGRGCISSRPTDTSSTRPKGMETQPKPKYAGARSLVRVTIPRSVTEMQPSLKIPSTRLGSFFLGSRNRGLSLVEKISGGVALTASKLTSNLPSIALRDRQLRSFAHFTP